MLTIFLNDLLFTANHGLYREENVLGGSFRVNITLNYTIPQTGVQEICQTINYVSVFEWVKRKMEKPIPLLETLVLDIAYGMLEKFEMAFEVNVKVEKLNPPIEGFQGRVGVSTHIKRKEF